VFSYTNFQRTDRVVLLLNSIDLCESGTIVKGLASLPAQQKFGPPGMENHRFTPSDRSQPVFGSPQSQQSILRF
jgi:hypothetical protein